MAGNETDARRRAESEYNEAKKKGVTGNDLAIIKGRAQAARITELSATGESEQAGGIFR